MGELRHRGHQAWRRARPAHPCRLRRGVQVAHARSQLLVHHPFGASALRVRHALEAGRPVVLGLLQRRQQRRGVYARQREHEEARVRQFSRPCRPRPQELAGQLQQRGHDAPAGDEVVCEHGAQRGEHTGLDQASTNAGHQLHGGGQNGEHLHRHLPRRHSLLGHLHLVLRLRRRGRPRRGRRVSVALPRGGSGLGAALGEKHEGEQHLRAALCGEAERVHLPRGHEREEAKGLIPHHRAVGGAGANDV